MAKHANSRDNSTTIHLLSHALHRIRSTPPRLISSPPTQPRRAAVSLILRVVPPPSFPLTAQSTAPNLSTFFDLDWVRHPDARAQLLFIRRNKPSAQREREVKGAGTGGNSHGNGNGPAHVAFPGGRTEESDEGALYTAMRQTWEEIGLDLAESSWTCVGQLDDREITTSLGKRLLMVLSPFVFLHLSPHEPTFEPPSDDQDTSLHWIPLSNLLTPTPTWSHVTIDISSRLAPRHTFLRTAVRVLVGNMRFRALVLTDKDESEYEREDRRELEKLGITPQQQTGQLSLWGLTLGMTLDLVAFMYPPHPEYPPSDPSSAEFEELGGMGVMPSMASVFPRFSYPDVNFWIWVFGRRYRAVLKAWESSVLRSRTSQGGLGSNERRINWSGQALNTFYAAVRKALVVVIVGRAVGVLFAFVLGSWWTWRRITG